MKKVYFPHLDALRFFAFVAVFVSHSAIFLGFDYVSPTYQGIKKSLLVHGDLGVGFFFVLSGFLITTLLFIERDARGHISILKFYARRILRIWPVYFMTLVIGFFVIPHIVEYIFAVNGGKGIVSARLFTADTLRALWYIFFVGNFDVAYHSYISPAIGVLWSIAVEEQFYIVWPVLLTAMFTLCKKRVGGAVIAGLAGLIICSFMYRYIHITDEHIVKYATLSVVSDLALGSLLATLINKYNWERFGKYVGRKINIAVYVSLFIFVCTRNFIGIDMGVLGAIYEALEPLIFSLFSAYIIFEQNYGSISLFKFSHFSQATYLGKISYGLYAYHMIAIFIVSTCFQKLGFLMGFDYIFTGFSIISVVLYIIIFLVAFALTVIGANFSYIYIEKKILALKDRIAS